MSKTEKKAAKVTKAAAKAKAELMKQPVVMDPKAIAAKAAADIKAAVAAEKAKAPKAAEKAAKKVKGPKGPNANIIEVLQAVKKGAVLVGNPKSKHAADGHPVWLKAQDGDDKLRVGYRLSHPYLKELKRTEDEVFYTIGPAGIAALKEAGA